MAVINSNSKILYVSIFRGYRSKMYHNYFIFFGNGTQALSNIELYLKENPDIQKEHHKIITVKEFLNTYYLGVSLTTYGNAQYLQAHNEVHSMCNGSIDLLRYIMKCICSDKNDSADLIAAWCDMYATGLITKEELHLKIKEIQ